MHILAAAWIQSNESPVCAIYVHAKIYIWQVLRQKKITFVTTGNDRITAKLFFLSICALAKTPCLTPSRMSPRRDIRRKANDDEGPATRRAVRDALEDRGGSGNVGPTSSSWRTLRWLLRSVQARGLGTIHDQGNHVGCPNVAGDSPVALCAAIG